MQTISCYFISFVCFYSSPFLTTTASSFSVHGAPTTTSTEANIAKLEHSGKDDEASKGLLDSSSQGAASLQTRIFGNKGGVSRLGGIQIGGDTTFHHNPAGLNDVGPWENKEERELESLKDENKKKRGGESKGMGILASHLFSTTAPHSASSSTKAKSVVTKKPVNEETPALSDNANSLKYPNHNPLGLDETLFFKKSFPPGPPLNEEEEREALMMTMMMMMKPFGQMMRGGTNPSDLDVPAAVDYNNGFANNHTPKDIAEYIFWTGDERGVANALSDFINEGVIGREDAVRFLEQVKRELSFMQGRYADNVLPPPVSGPHSFPPSPSVVDGWRFGPGMDQYLQPKRSDYILEPPSSSSSLDGDYFNHHHQQHHRQDSTSTPEEKLLLDGKMRELALEEVIYQLGKKYLVKTSNEERFLGIDPKDKLKEIVNEMEMIMPKDLQRDVVDVLIGAYIDGMKEGRGGGSLYDGM